VAGDCLCVGFSTLLGAKRQGIRVDADCLCVGFSTLLGAKPQGIRLDGRVFIDVKENKTK